MSLLKRIESAGAAAAKPVGPTSAPPVPDAPPESPLGNGGASGSLVLPPPPSVPPPPRPAGTPGISPAKDRSLQINRDLKTRVKAKLISELDPSMDLSRKDEVRQRLQSLFDQ